MKSDPIHQRLARLQRECDLVVGPVLLLWAICAVLVVALGLHALFDEPTPAQAAEPNRHLTPPAT